MNRAVALDPLLTCLVALVLAVAGAAPARAQTPSAAPASAEASAAPGSAAPPSAPDSTPPSTAPVSTAPSAAPTAPPATASRDAACPAGNLLDKRKPLFWEYAVGAERTTDGIAPEEGDTWKSDATVELTTAAGHVDFDLGAITRVTALLVQGDNNDDYPVEISDDRLKWRPLWNPPHADGAGMRTRTTDQAKDTGRYLRFGAAKGDGSYSLGEVQAYCSKPATFPPELSRKKGVFKDDNDQRNRKYANAKMDMGLLCLTAFFFLFVARPAPGQKRDLWNVGASAATVTLIRYLTLFAVLQDQPNDSWRPLLNNTTWEFYLPGTVVLTFIFERWDLTRFAPWLAAAASLLTVVHSVLLANTVTGLAPYTYYLGAAVAAIAIGAFLVARARKGDLRIAAERSILGTIALTAAFAWTNYGAFHGSRTIHFWDTFHYYAGSKYFKENHYTNLYYCVQWAEIDAGRMNVVKARKVRNLKTNLLETTDDIIAHPEVCRDAFTADRWKQFRADVEYFRARMGADWWDKMFKDHGYNASPVWNLFGSRFANMEPASDSQIRDIALLDAFFYVSMFLAILWAFGLRACALALVVLGIGYPWAYYWTGGAFARVAWLWDAVLGVCFLKRRWYFLGGAALMGSFLDRVFPGALFGGFVAAVGAIAIREAFAVKGLDAGARLRTLGASLWREIRHMRLPYRNAFFGAVAAAAIALPLGAVSGGGWESYTEFLDNSQKHVKTPLTNHMGVPTILTYDPDFVARKTKNDKLEDPFEGWKDKRNEILAGRQVFVGLIMIGFFVLIGLWSRAHGELWELAAASTLFIVGLFQLTCYYYNFVVLLAPLAVRRPKHALWLIGATLLGHVFQLNIGWLDEQYIWESVIILAYMLYLFIDGYFSDLRDERAAALPAPEAEPETPPATEDAPAAS